MPPTLRTTFPKAAERQRTALTTPRKKKTAMRQAGEPRQTLPTRHNHLRMTQTLPPPNGQEKAKGGWLRRGRVCSCLFA